jgi:hypothetical protein
VFCNKGHGLVSTGIRRQLILRYDGCLRFGVDYVEKLVGQPNSSAVGSELFLLEVEISNKTMLFLQEHNNSI